MSWSTSEAFRRALHADGTGDAFLVLLTLEHDDLPAPIRVTSDEVDTQSRGESYVAFPFELTLPDDGERPPRARLVIDNVSREIVAAVRSIVGPPLVTMEIVRGSAPDDVEASFPFFRLINVGYDSLTVEGELVAEDLSREPFPEARFVPSRFPGLF